MPNVPEFITDSTYLREICGDFKEKTAYKIHDELTDQAQAFIKRSPFALLSTLSTSGAPTISPKGGRAGFIGFEGNTLFLPDKKGNNLIFSLQNILENPNIGLLFLVPGTNETLRVHGLAQLTEDAELCARYPLDGKPARLVTMIELRSSYFHCSTSLHSGKLWNPESWTEQMTFSWAKEMDANFEAGKKIIP